MNRHVGAALTVIGCLAVGCATRYVEVPRVVTVTVPYVATLPLDPTDSTAVGRTGCDLNGMPVVWIHPRLSPEDAQWVLVHEKIHVAQKFAYGGCRLFMEKYVRDRLFRLQMEAEAYCGVYLAQLAAKVLPKPTRAEIADGLRLGYLQVWTEEEIRRAMAC